MAEKKTELSIILRTVDKATAKIKAVNDKLDAATKPIRDFRKALGELHEKSGLADVVSGFKGVGDAIAGILSKVAVIGGVLGAATAGLLSIVDGFDELGDKAERIGVSVDFLAQMRYAAERSGASVESLDSGLQSFTKNLGLARANTGLMTKFLGNVSPVLLKQLKATKTNEEAFNLLAGAMAKIEDPAKRAAFAQKTLGDASLAPLFHKGAKGVQELRDRYAELAGPQGEAADAAGKTDDALKDLKASTDGVKAALVRGLAPALTVIIGKLTTWFTGHRAEIAEWAASIGEKLPAAVERVVTWIGKAYDKVASFVDMIGGFKTIAIAAGVIIAGPLVSAIVSLGTALFTAGTAMSSLVSKTSALGKVGGAAGGLLGAATSVAVPLAVSKAVSDATGGSLQEQAHARGWKGEDWDLAGMAKFIAAQKSNGGGADISAQLAAFRGAAAAPQSAKVTIELANAPKGTRVNSDPRNTADVDFTMGVAMGVP